MLVNKLNKLNQTDLFAPFFTQYSHAKPRSSGNQPFVKSQKERIHDLVVTRHYVAQKSIWSGRTLKQCIFQEVVDNLNTVSLEDYCYNYQDSSVGLQYEKWTWILIS